MADYKRFPHLGGATDFPHASTIDVYKYENRFEYNRWPSNVELTLCNVPWCGDYENVVKFADDATRDEWFDGLEDTETIVLDTMRHVVPEQSVKVPVPIGVMQHFNYLMVKMPRFTSDDRPLEYADGTWKSRYFYFIDNAVERAGSTTECVLRCDYWTTYINDLTFDYAMLARGHAPVAATDVDAYLSDPISNASLLLAPDVTFGNARIVRENASVLYNGDQDEQLFVMVSAAALRGDWGSASRPEVPAYTMTIAQHVPSPYAYAVRTADAQGLVNHIALNLPQFLMTVKCAFFVSSRLVSVSSRIDVGGYDVMSLGTSGIVTDDLLDLDRASFGYPDEAAGYAKLYTYPYARIEVSDPEGRTVEVRIEDTGGKLSVKSKASLIFPWIGIDCNLMGSGGADGTEYFYNLSSARFPWSYQGRIAETQIRLDIPTFAITQPASSYANYTSDYDRTQARLAADNALASALASNATANTNAANSANTAETNANNSAANIVANNAVAVAASSNKTARTNSAASQGTGFSQNHIRSMTALDVNSMSASYLAEKDGLAVAATNNDTNATASAIGGVVATVGSLASGNIGGVVSGIGSIANAGVSWATTNASIAVSQSNADTIYQASIAAANGKALGSISNSENNNVVQTTAATDLTEIDNSASTSMASNNAGLINTNAANTRATAVGNANRTKATADANANRVHDTAVAAIQARLDQASVDAPMEFGQRSNGEHAVTKPVGLVAQVVTQPDGAIMQAASQFARYGYALNQQWRITDLQVMRHFTYWECPEVWCAGDGNAVEVAQQAVKDIMERGVTVWSVPEEIGRVSVYDN